MTPEQQRIAIAEACGWVWRARSRGSIKVWDNPPSYVFHDSQLPDYLNSLDAMRESEETLDCNEWETWHRIVGEWPTDLARLTATQRADAFLRTKNLWKD